MRCARSLQEMFNSHLEHLIASIIPVLVLSTKEPHVSLQPSILHPQPPTRIPPLPLHGSESRRNVKNVKPVVSLLRLVCVHRAFKSTSDRQHIVVYISVRRVTYLSRAFLQSSMEQSSTNRILLDSLPCQRRDTKPSETCIYQSQKLEKRHRLTPHITTITFHGSDMKICCSILLSRDSHVHFCTYKPSTYGHKIFPTKSKSMCG